MPRVAHLIQLDRREKAELIRLARAPSSPQALARRARLVLAAARGDTNKQIAAGLHLTPATVGNWRARFAAWGLAGLRVRQGAGRHPKYGPEVVERLRRLLGHAPPDGKQRWTVRSLAAKLGIPRSTVHDMLRALYRPRRL